MDIELIFNNIVFVSLDFESILIDLDFVPIAGLRITNLLQIIRMLQILRIRNIRIIGIIRIDS